MHIRGAAGSAVQDLLEGPSQRASVLGAGPRAIYLAVGRGTPQRVLAILTADAVRLPCAVVVNAPLPQPGPVATVGDGAVRWDRPACVTITAARYWPPARVRPAAPRALALRAAIDRADTGVADDLVRALGRRTAAAARALLGRGPGLTPAGDDVLAGFLLGARAYGLDAGPVRATVAATAGAATTALSAQLLRHALAGECVPEVLPALERGRPAALLRVGHTSGAALARGLLLAAELSERTAAA